MKPASRIAPRYFARASAWGRWLKEHHARATELLVGFHKAGSGRPSMTWSQSVDEALCVGWIDGVRRSLGRTSYTIRFCRRKPGSTWSKVNIAKAEALVAAGHMLPAGLEAYRRRDAARSGIYSFEQGPVELDAGSRKAFEADSRAWAFFEAQPPGYRKKMIWRILSARQPATRERRLARTIAASRQGIRL